MEAGRELDALIAEKVMGQKVVNGYVFTTVRIPCPDGKDGCLVLHYGEVRQPVSRFSTDITAAWVVADKLKLRITPRHDGTYSAEEDCGVIELADTAPLAICRAALRVVGA